MMTVNPRTRTAGVSHGGATKRRLLGVPVRSIVAWELFSRAAVAIVTWLRAIAFGGPVSVRQVVRGRASPTVLCLPGRAGEERPGTAALHECDVDRERSNWAQSQR